VEAAGGGAAADGTVYTVLGWAGEPGLEVLSAALEHDAVRSEVAEAILAVGSPALPLLVQQLTGGSPAARVSAALLIGAIGDPRGAPALIEALSSHDSELVITAARALAALADHGAIDSLLELFGHPHVGVRQAAIAAVNSLDADASRLRLLPLLAAANPSVRECAVRSVGYFAADSCATSLLEALTDEAEEVRRAAIEQLPLIDDPRSTPALLEALTGEAPRNRAAAAHALRLCDDGRADAALIDALDDEHAWVRYFAAESLAYRGTPAETLEAVARADAAPHVRIAALRALSRLDVPALMRIAPSAIEDDDQDVAAAAVAALSTARGPESETLIERALQSPADAVRIAAAETLGYVGTPAAIQMLAWAARLPDPLILSTTAMASLRRVAAAGGEHAASAALALLHLGSDRARRDDVVALMGTLEPESVASLSGGDVRQPALRAVAVDALARMRKPAATAQVAAALADPDPVVRRTAVDAFGRLGTSAVASAISAMAANDPDTTVRRRAAAVCRRYGWCDRRPEERS